MHYTVMTSAVCNVCVVWEGKNDRFRVRRIFLLERGADARRHIKRFYQEATRSQCKGVDALLRGIRRYFKSGSIGFDLSDTHMAGRSKFENNVYKATAHIPPGKVASYRTLASMCDCRSARAIGRVMAKNPYPLLVPCHRVIHSSGKIGGFQTGPLMKRRLLELEGVKFDESGTVPKSFFLCKR
ncbi:MAG: methylated-DNA--[protein]-cysteine S-methyltransferase [Candidatus Omnitrophica bacterium]|nr:methylated-DNA--[protein]-cysteine S-methyltransferase [Candidatus Omnitrophota bacterium]